jgi:hypothetical protein
MGPVETAFVVIVAAALIGSAAPSVKPSGALSAIAQGAALTGAGAALAYWLNG